MRAALSPQHALLAGKSVAKRCGILDQDIAQSMSIPFFFFSRPRATALTARHRRERCPVGVARQVRLRWSNVACARRRRCGCAKGMAEGYLQRSSRAIASRHVMSEELAAATFVRR